MDRGHAFQCHALHQNNKVAERHRILNKGQIVFDAVKAAQVNEVAAQRVLRLGKTLQFRVNHNGRDNRLFKHPPLAGQM